MEMANEMAVIFEERVKAGRIKCPKAIKLINLYMDEIENTNQEKIKDRLTSLMILRYLIVSGDDMNLDGSAAEFQKSYRSWGVIPSNGLCSHDCVMWNLMHSDELIWTVLEKFIAWRDNPPVSWKVSLLNREFVFDWPSDADGHIQSFFVSDRHLYACSASVLELKVSPDGISAPEEATTVCIEFNFDFYVEEMYQSSKTNLMLVNPQKKAA